MKLNCNLYGKPTFFLYSLAIYEFGTTYRTLGECLEQYKRDLQLLCSQIKDILDNKDGAEVCIILVVQGVPTASHGSQNRHREYQARHRRYQKRHRRYQDRYMGSQKRLGDKEFPFFTRLQGVAMRLISLWVISRFYKEVPGTPSMLLAKKYYYYGRAIEFANNMLATTRTTGGLNSLYVCYF